MGRTTVPRDVILAMRADYISNNMTLDELSKKYNISPNTIAGISSREKWVEEIKNITKKAHAKISKECEKKTRKTLEDILDIADEMSDVTKMMLEDIAKRYWEAESPRDRHQYAQSVNFLSRALKDTKEIKMLRSSSDEREQEARIRKLEKESVTDDAEKTITVIFADSDSEGFGD